MRNLRQLTPRLYHLRLSVGQAYLWLDDDGVTMVDTGGPGCLPEIRAAFRRLGLGCDDLRRIVLTHGHGSNAGATAEVARWSADVVVHAHREDAAVIRGELPPARPRIEGPGTWLSAELIAALARFPAAPVHIEVENRDIIDFGGGAVIHHTPGHTAGSIAVHLPEHQVVFTGGAAIRTARGITFGQVNEDHDDALSSFARIALLRPEIACFGFGPAVVGSAADRLMDAFDVLDASHGHLAGAGPDVRKCAW